MKKRTMALLLAGAMTTTVFTGCSRYDGCSED